MNYHPIPTQYRQKADPILSQILYQENCLPVFLCCLPSNRESADRDLYHAGPRVCQSQHNAAAAGPARVVSKETYHGGLLYRQPSCRCARLRGIL
eukprot:1140217-Pelagomonas_calceolata.AAC.1